MRILIVMLALLVGVAPAAADRKDKLKKRIRTMRAIVLVQELDLDEATAGKLMPILNKYDDDFAKLATENQQLRKQVDDLGPTAGDKAIEAVIDKMVANRRARWDLEEKRFAEVRKVLSARQAARILVVLPQIDRKILEGARRASRGGGPGKALKRNGAGRGETR